MADGTAGSLYIEHTGAGAQLTLAEARGLSMAGSMGPDSWPQQGVTLGGVPIPFYLDPLDTGKR